MKVLVVDDSAVVRQVLTMILSSRRGVSVVAAADPVIASDKIARQRPDVIVLDLEMPRMDGLTFLRHVMASPEPIPVVVCSSLARSGTDVALQALEEGAVAVVERPRLGLREFLHDQSATLIETVRAGAEVRVRQRGHLSHRPLLTADAILPVRRAPSPTGMVVAIGASTGGTEALRAILTALPADAPPIAIVQHMPEGFTRAFADRLNDICRVEVREAEPGLALTPGRAIVAHGNRHLIVRGGGSEYVVDVVSGPPVSRHRPSVDVLFRSVVQCAGAQSVGVLLTGMGRDGADGLLEMRKAGAATIAQDADTSVVFGMPREAIALGAAEDVAPLSQIAARILRRAASKLEPGPL